MKQQATKPNIASHFCYLERAFQRLKFVKAIIFVKTTIKEEKSTPSCTERNIKRIVSITIFQTSQSEDTIWGYMNFYETFLIHSSTKS